MKFFLCCFLLLSSFCASAQLQDSSRPTGFVSVTAVMTISYSSYMKLVNDPLQWKDEKIKRQSYEGKKVKRILYQKTTNRVVVYTAGDNCWEMNRATAIREGFIAAPKVVEKKTFSPYSGGAPWNYYIDSPLYVGLKNKVRLTLYTSEELPEAPPGVTVNRPDDDDASLFEITVSQPGQVILTVTDHQTGVVKSIYHLIAKRTPEDDLQKLPVVQIGNISTQTTTVANLLEQQSVTVSDGYEFAGATVYFTGPVFRDILTPAADAKLTYLKHILICVNPVARSLLIMYG